MDRQQEIQEDFNRFFQSLFPNEGQPFVFLSSVATVTEKANQCLSRGESIAEENGVVASEYYCLASFVCLLFLRENGFVDSLYTKGSQASKQALEILPKDYEYLVFTLFYRILVINVDEDGAEEAYTRLQQIHHECPPFHIVDHTLFKPEWLEDVYNQLFEARLQEVCVKIDEDYPTKNGESAALLLKTFPATISKLIAFYNLSKIYLTQGKEEEALRDAKLGVEVLGSDLEYDYHKFEHWLWGECWALVGIINRKKKEYDFAEGVLEKGSRLGIVSCMIPLAEMYENGEGDDPNPKEAERYRDLANTTQEARDKEMAEEEERIRKEEEARLAEIQRQEEERIAEMRRKEEEQRLAEEMEARKEEIKRKTILLWIGIIACSIAIIAGSVFLCQRNILDRVVQYEKNGMAILNIDVSDPVPYAIVMNNDGIYCDNMHRVYRILPVGVQISTKEIKLSYTSDGLKANLVESIGGLTITKSRGHYIIRLTDYSFLLLDHKNQNDPMVSPDQKFNQCYLILIREKTKTVIKVSKCVTDGSGFLVGTLTGDLLDRYKSDFKNSFKEKEYNTIVERGYGHFEASYELSLRDGGLNIIDNVIFRDVL